MAIFAQCVPNSDSTTFGQNCPNLVNCGAKLALTQSFRLRERRARRRPSTRMSLAGSAVYALSPVRGPKGRQKLAEIGRCWPNAAESGKLLAQSQTMHGVGPPMRRKRPGDAHGRIDRAMLEKGRNFCPAPRPAERDLASTVRALLRAIRRAPWELCTCSA